MVWLTVNFFFFFFNDTATTEIYTLSLHALFRSRSTYGRPSRSRCRVSARSSSRWRSRRSEEHTSELQSPCNLVCRLLLEKKKPSRLPVSHSRALVMSACRYQPHNVVCDPPTALH